MRRLLLLLALLATAPLAAQTPGEPPEFDQGWQARLAGDFVKARELYEIAIQKGSLRAISNLGVLYEYGWGVPVDHPRAFALYAQAAERGNPAGMSNMAMFLLKGGTGIAIDTARAVPILRKAAEARDPAAMEQYAWLMTSGLGMPVDTVQGVQWWERAAAAGRTWPMNLLGWAYEAGFGVPRDTAKMLMWYERAADGGVVAAARKLGDLYWYGRAGLAPNRWAAMGLYQQAADLGDTAYVRWLPSGLADTSLPRDTAMHWFTRANARGTTNEQKYAIYREAARAGSIGGAYELVKAHQYGLGVPKDTAIARRLTRICAVMGASDCQNILGQDFQFGFGGAKNAVLAQATYDRSAKQGNTLAMFLLAEMYDRGLGVARNDALATYWYITAYNKGSTRAKVRLEQRGLLRPNPEVAAFLARIDSEGPDRSNLDRFHYEVAVYCKFGGSKCTELTRQANRMLDSQNAAASAANMQRIWNLYAGPATADTDAEWRRRSQCLATNMEVINKVTRGQADWRGVQECR